MNIETWFNTASVKRHYFPGRIFVGPGVFRRAIELCLQIEGQIAIVADQIVHDLPFVQEELAALAHRNPYLKLVSGAPIAQDVEAVTEALGATPAVFLSIGGGSATDFAKAAIAHFLFGSFDGIGLRGQVGESSGRPRPVLVSVPTTAGSGAEASRYYVTYDREDNHKVFGKSWHLVADWIMLDPIFLRSAPDSLLVSCAFDVFVHLFESMICRYESSWMGRALSLDGIAYLMDALDRVIYQGRRGDSEFCALLETATLGGVAISNVRTGNIHEAAGALLELTDLSHPQTLFVFFRDAIEQYLSQIAESEAALIARLRQTPSFSHFTRLDDVIRWWEALFAHTGMVERIYDSVRRLRASRALAKTHIFDRVFSDKVWISKESPVVLDEAAVSCFVDRSLARFGCTINPSDGDRLRRT